MLQRRELANYLLQAVGWFPLRPNLGNAVSWPMRSGKLLSWYPSRPTLCNAVSWPMVSGRLLG